MPTNNNPKGKNQHPNCPAVDDQRIPELLRAYHRQGITDRKRLSKLLLDEHAIQMSEATISRRRRELGLRASGLTTQALPDTIKRQLVLDQMAKDPEGKLGAVTIKAMIFRDTGLDITRDWIRKEMSLLAPGAFASRRPRHKASPRPRDTSAEAAGASPDSPPRRDYDDSSHDSPLFTPFMPGTSPAPVPPTAPTLGPTGSHPPAQTPSSSRARARTPRPSSPAPAPATMTPNSNLSAPAPPPTQTQTTTTTTAILSLIAQTTPHLSSLTHALTQTHAHALVQDPSARERVMECMEAAALLERALARVAGGG